MKRRNFLGMLGAAIAAPMMPMATSAAGYSRTTYELAIAHAKKYPLVSVSGMSKRIGISTPEANAIINKMSSEGMLGVINPTRPGTVRASSKIFVNNVYPIRPTSEARAQEPAPKSEPHRIRAASQDTNANIDLMLAHLRGLCVQRGMTLSARCYTGALI
jgi:hypothetical protein